MYHSQISAFAQRLKTFGLRFPSEEEGEFKASLEPEVLWFGTVGQLLGFIAWLFYLVPYAFDEGIPDMSVDIKACCFYGWSSAAVLCGSVSLLGYLRQRHGWFQNANWEAIFLGSWTYCLIILAFLNKWHTPLMFGKDPNNFWKYDQRGVEMQILLCNDFCLTCVTMYIPVRACVLWLMPVLGTIPYLINLVLLGTAFPREAPSNISLLISLVVFAVRGAHRIEVQRRKEWILARDQHRELLEQQVHLQVSEHLLE